MKIFFHPKSRKEGSILLLTLILAIIMGTALGSYLVLASGQQGSVARSQRWNAALNIAEAGIEEGLAQVNASPSDFSVNGWTLVGTTNYGPERQTLAHGSYSVLIAGKALPTIYSTGFVTAPITGTVMSRTIRVTTQVLPLFNVALGAVGNIDMNGHNMVTDSWNSHSTNLSNNGLYTSSKISTNGDVASEQGIVNIGQQTVNGNLYLGPTATYVSGTNQVLGTIHNDYNVNFPEVTMPASAATALPPVTTNGVDLLAMDNTTYIVSDNKPIEVPAGYTNVTLIVHQQNWSPTSITLDGGTTNAAFLTVYDDPSSPGGSVTIGGNSSGGGIGATPVNFIFYGTANLATLSLFGTSTFIGAIYAPDSLMKLSGGGNSYNLMGAAIVKNASIEGHYDIHYDEALSKFGPAKGFIANSWQEL
jgi:hypothetical protein